MSGDPFSKDAQLARGSRRYRRKVASPKQWQAIIAAKGSTCRLAHSHDQPPFGPVEYHHLIARTQGGDDVPENIVPLCTTDHELVTGRHKLALYRLRESLTHSEYAYLLEKVGEPGIERLFGVPGE